MYVSGGTAQTDIYPLMVYRSKGAKVHTFSYRLSNPIHVHGSGYHNQVINNDVRSDKLGKTHRDKS